MKKAIALVVVWSLFSTLLAGCRPGATSPSGIVLGIAREPAPWAPRQRKLASLPAYNPKAEFGFQVDLRGFDLSDLDLTGRAYDLLHADFSTATRWPAHLPEPFDPVAIMELGKNPGLDVRMLHEQGVTGRGVGVAIIDQPLLIGHMEYKDRLRCYEELGIPKNEQASMHGPAVASIAVGKTVGVAPEADLYYFGVGFGDYILGSYWTYVVEAVERILRLNENLPPDNKIRVISISAGWEKGQVGYERMVRVVEEAKRRGVFVVASLLQETYGFWFSGAGRDPLADPDQASSYGAGTHWAGSLPANADVRSPAHLLVPMDSRGTASPGAVDEYVFYPEGGRSWAIPYLAGLYALCCQVKPDITPEAFWNTALETGTPTVATYEGTSYPIGMVINPMRIVEALESGMR